LHKKLAAALTIAIFALSSVAILAPVAAHTTEGNLLPTFPFHINDSDTNPQHVPGPTAYVWPGGGLNTFGGAFNGFPPGYQNPYGTYPTGQPSSNYQLQGTAYSPFGAILTSTEDHPNKGPLIFALNFTCLFPIQQERSLCATGYNYNFTGLSVYFSPEWDLNEIASNPGLTQGTWFSHADQSWVIRLGPNDPIMPNGWMWYSEGDIHWWGNHNWMEWYYLRFNNVVAPQVAGKYVFKVFLWDDFGMNVPGMWNLESLLTVSPRPGDTTVCDPSGAICKIGFGATAYTVPSQNWPVILVKGEIDPGIVTGTIRYGGYNQTLYSRPINVAGKVWLDGVANDPYTGQSTGRKVMARGYFNASAAGHYEVEGVAPGVYDVYASAAGYPTQLIASQITILPGQSFHLDGYLNPGAVIHGQVFSKHLFGEEPWPSNPRPISVYIYSSNQYSDENAVTWSPWNQTHAPYMSYNWLQAVSGVSTSFFPQPVPVAFPWDSGTAVGGSPYPVSYYSKAFPGYSGPDVAQPIGPFNCGTTGITNAAWGDSFPMFAGQPPGTDVCSVPNGVGPAQYWWVDSAGRFTNGGGSNSFKYEFGTKGVYGAPTKMDGDVPQPLATWVDGLEAGRYWVRVWLNGYVQTLQDGVTLDEYYFDVAKNEWAGDIFMPSDLRVSSAINKTVHFHDLPGTLQECPIEGCLNNVAKGNSAGNRYLIAEVRDSNGVLYGLNFTYVQHGQTSAVVSVNGFGMIGPDAFTNPLAPIPSEFNTADLVQGTLTARGAHRYTSTGMKYSYFYYCVYNGACGGSPSGGHDYGLPSGTYTVYVYMRGYVQQTYESVSVTLSGSPALISNHLYRGARFNVTLYSIDWEHPRVQRPWAWPGAGLRVYFANDQFPNGRRFGGGIERGGSSMKQPANANPNYPLAASYRLDGGCDVGTSPTDITTPGFVDVCHIIEADGNLYPDQYGPDLSSQFGQFVPLELGLNPGFLLFPSPSTIGYRTGARLKFIPINAYESGTYKVFAYTYGYLQYQVNPVYVPKGGFGDIRVQLLQGVNLTINIPFKTEGIYSPTTANMTMRVRVFNDQGLLVGTAATIGPDLFSTGGNDCPPGGQILNNGMCTPNGQAGGRASVIGGGDNRYGIAESYYVDPYAFVQGGFKPDGSVDPNIVSDTFLWYGTYNLGPGDRWYAFDSRIDPTGTFQGIYNSFSNYNPNLPEWKTWIPAGTKQVRVLIAGIYDIFGDVLDSAGSGVISEWKPPGVPQSFLYYGIPGFSSTLAGSYTGSYSVEVDFWNLYPNATFTSQYTQNFPPGLWTTPNVFVNPHGMADPTNWFPPVEGLLQGDSFHTIPGHSAGPFGYAGDSLAANGLGPYAQRAPWIIPNAHLGAEASAIFEVDKRGFISGNVYGFNFANELRPESWATISFAAAAGNLTFTSWTWDSFYGQYLDPGGYTANVFLWTPSGNQGYNTVSSSVNISSGQSTSGVTFQLERSNIPVPEFTSLAIIAFSALAASVYLLRRRR